MKVEKDILNFKAACSRARRRAMSLGVPVEIRRRGWPYPIEGDEWEIVYDDPREAARREDIERSVAEHEAEVSIEATDAFLDRWGDKGHDHEGRIVDAYGNYVPDFTPEKDGDCD